uniref:Ring finger protein 32 n=1 Tax=Scleropages formosus TaxID=113540 RepID=A0A8C9QXB9_SCLFO
MVLFSFVQNLSSKTDERLAIRAVALQDHMARTLHMENVSLREPVRRRCSSVQKKGKHREKTPSIQNLPLPSQRLGLVDAPPISLTTQEWEHVKARSVQEGDSVQPCVICREEFRLQVSYLPPRSQCSRFSGKKCCPMCRREQYETRVIHDGARIYREKCAVRIQACWRGHVVRKWYKEIRKTVPPKDKLLRRKFFEIKLQEVSDSFLQSCNTNVEEFLDTLDDSVELSRTVFRQFEMQHISTTTGQSWEEIRQKALQRETLDCPICLAPLGLDGAETGGDRHRVRALLSCSHLFHLCCLESFEVFCWDENLLCPLCRSPYQKMII